MNTKGYVSNSNTMDLFRLTSYSNFNNKTDPGIVVHGRQWNCSTSTNDNVSKKRIQSPAATRPKTATPDQSKNNSTPSKSSTKLIKNFGYADIYSQAGSRSGTTLIRPSSANILHNAANPHIVTSSNDLTAVNSKIVQYSSVSPSIIQSRTSGVMMQPPSTSNFNFQYLGKTQNSANNDFISRPRPSSANSSFNYNPSNPSSNTTSPAIITGNHFQRTEIDTTVVLPSQQQQQQQIVNSFSSTNNNIFAASTRRPLSASKNRQSTNTSPVPTNVSAVPHSSNEIQISNQHMTHTNITQSSSRLSAANIRLLYGINPAQQQHGATLNQAENKPKGTSTIQNASSNANSTTGLITQQKPPVVTQHNENESKDPINSTIRVGHTGSAKQTSVFLLSQQQNLSGFHIRSNVQADRNTSSSNLNEKAGRIQSNNGHQFAYPAASASVSSTSSFSKNNHFAMVTTAPTTLVSSLQTNTSRPKSAGSTRAQIFNNSLTNLHHNSSNNSNKSNNNLEESRQQISDVTKEVSTFKNRTEAEDNKNSFNVGNIVYGPASQRFNEMMKATVPTSPITIANNSRVGEAPFLNLHDVLQNKTNTPTQQQQVILVNNSNKQNNNINKNNDVTVVQTINHPIGASSSNPSAVTPPSRVRPMSAAAFGRDSNVKTNSNNKNNVVYSTASSSPNNIAISSMVLGSHGAPKPSSQLSANVVDPGVFANGLTLRRKNNTVSQAPSNHPNAAAANASTNEMASQFSPTSRHLQVQQQVQQQRQLQQPNNDVVKLTSHTSPAQQVVKTTGVTTAATTTFAANSTTNVSPTSALVGMARVRPQSATASSKATNNTGDVYDNSTNPTGANTKNNNLNAFAASPTQQQQKSSGGQPHPTATVAANNLPHNGTDNKDQNAINDDAHIPVPSSTTGTNQDGGNTKSSSSWTMSKRLGEGAYAIVRLAHHRVSGKRAAVKVYEKSKLQDPQRLRAVRREIKLLARLEHKGIVRLLEAIEASEHVYVVMELAAGGSLYHMLKRQQPSRRLPEHVARAIFTQLIHAIGYCHSNLVAHRDLKLENVLLDSNGNVKLVDFGFATLVPPGRHLKVFCGTPSYMAPEIVARKEYDGFAADIWAAGILLFALLCGYLPFRAPCNKELYKKVWAAKVDLPNWLSSSAAALLRWMMQHDPSARPTVNEVLSSSWMRCEPQPHSVDISPFLDREAVMQLQGSAGAAIAPPKKSASNVVGTTSTPQSLNNKTTTATTTTATAAVNAPINNQQINNNNSTKATKNNADENITPMSPTMTSLRAGSPGIPPACMSPSLVAPSPPVAMSRPMSAYAATGRHNHAGGLGVSRQVNETMRGELNRGGGKVKASDYGAVGNTTKILDLLEDEDGSSCRSSSLSVDKKKDKNKKTTNNTVSSDELKTIHYHQSQNNIIRKNDEIQNIVTDYRKKHKNGDIIKYEGDAINEITARISISEDYNDMPSSTSIQHNKNNNNTNKNDNNNAKTSVDALGSLDFSVGAGHGLFLSRAMLSSSTMMSTVSASKSKNTQLQRNLNVLKNDALQHKNPINNAVIETAQINSNSIGRPQYEVMNNSAVNNLHSSNPNANNSNNKTDNANVKMKVNEQRRNFDGATLLDEEPDGLNEVFVDVDGEVDIIDEESSLTDSFGSHQLKSDKFKQGHNESTTAALHESKKEHFLNNLKNDLSKTNNIYRGMVNVSPNQTNLTNNQASFDTNVNQNVRRIRPATAKA